LSLVVLKYIDSEKHCKMSLIKMKLFTTPVTASFIRCKLLYSCFSLWILEIVGFSIAATQAFGSNVKAMLNLSEVKEIQQSI